MTASDDTGAVLVFVAVLIPILVLLGSFAVDLSSFFVHKRQLQVKADAAALAGAGDLAAQIEADGACDAGAVYDAVFDYGKVRNQLTGLDGNAESRVEDPALNAEPDLTGDPCDDAVVDVTVRETDVPYFFQLTRTVEEITARARVEIQTAGQQAGIAPLGVPLPPDDAAVILNGTEYPLTPLPDADDAGRTLFTADVPYTVPAATSVDVRLGSSVLYEDVGHIRGYETPDSTGTQAPRLGAVNLESNLSSCAADASGRPYFFSSQQSCAVGISAEIDWNAGVSAAQVALQKVWAVVGGTEYALTYDAPTSRWRRPLSDLPVADGAGAVPITIRYHQQHGHVGGTGNNRRCPSWQGCRGDFGATVARPYNGPTDELGRFEIGGTDAGGNAVSMGMHAARLGSTQTLRFTVGVTSNLSLGGSVRTLRLSGSNQTGGIVCDGWTGSWDDSFVSGCERPYQVNRRGTTCSPELDPLDCLDPRTGGAPDPSGALSDRIGCSANDYPGKDGDPRLVNVALVDHGSFNATGGSLGVAVPVRGFAWFYITGWSNNQGTRSGCAGDEYPPGASGSREIYGRYVKRVDGTSPGQIGSGTLCKFTDIYGCIAVVTH